MSIYCSLEPLVSLPALLSLLLSSPKWLFLRKKKNKPKTFSACLGGSAISSYFMLTEGAGERVLLVAKLILGGPTHLSLASLMPFLVCCGLEVRSSSFSLVDIWNSSSKFESKRYFLKWKVSVLCSHYQENFHFPTVFIIWGLLRVLNSFEERPFGVRFCFSVLVFTGSGSAGRNTRLICVSFLAKCICMRKWLTAGFFLSLLCPSFCLLINKTSPCTC